MSKIVNMLSNVEIEGGTQSLLNLNFSLPFEAQVQDWVTNNISTLVNTERVVLVGQSVAACLVLPALELVRMLPQIALVQPGSNEISGWLDTGNYRHQEIRPRRKDLKEGQAFEGITVFDGRGQGLTATQYEQISNHFGFTKERIRVINVGIGQVNMANPTSGMVKKILNSDFNAEDAKHPERIAYIPAGAGIVGALMALTIYGLIEVWPATVRLNKKGEEFVVEEIVQPQDMRQFGAMAAKEFRDKSAPARVSKKQIIAQKEAIAAALGGGVESEIRKQLSETLDWLETL